MFPSRFKASIGHVGVDFGARGLKLLQVRRQGAAIRVIGAARVHHPESSTKVDISELVEPLREVMVSNGFTGRQCVLSLGRDDVQAQSVRLPRLSDAELREAVLWEASDRFKLDRESIQVDFVRLGEVSRGGEQRDEVLILAADHDLLRRSCDALMEAGLRPVAVDFGLAAMIRAHSLRCRREADRGEVRAIFEIGATGATFCVLRGDQMGLCKPIPIGGNDFTQSVADHLGIEPSVAAELRSKRIMDRFRPAGASPSSADGMTDRAMFEAVRATMERASKEISLCLRYYGVTFRGKPPDRIILAGGDALEPQLDEVLSRTVKLPVMLDDPASPMAQLYDEIIRVGGRDAGPPQAWSVAAGLSMRGFSQRALQKASEAGVAMEAA